MHTGSKLKPLKTKGNFDDLGLCERMILDVMFDKDISVRC